MRKNILTITLLIRNFLKRKHLSIFLCSLVIGTLLSIQEIKGIEQDETTRLQSSTRITATKTSTALSEPAADNRHSTKVSSSQNLSNDTVVVIPNTTGQKNLHQDQGCCTASSCIKTCRILFKTLNLAAGLAGAGYGLYQNGYHQPSDLGPLLGIICGGGIWTFIWGRCLLQDCSCN